MNRLSFTKNKRQRRNKRWPCGRSQALSKVNTSISIFTMGHCIWFCSVLLFGFPFFFPLFFSKTSICTGMLAFWMEFFFWQFWRPSCGHGISLLCLITVSFDKRTNSDLKAVSVKTNATENNSTTGFEWGKQSNFHSSSRHFAYIKIQNRMFLFNTDLIIHIRKASKHKWFPAVTKCWLPLKPSWQFQL